MMTSKIIITLSTILCLERIWTTVDASHFRGGVLSWRPVQSQIEISYTVSFRSSSGDEHFCNEAIKNNGILLRGEGELECETGCSNTVMDPMSYYCTNYSEQFDSTTGQNIVLYSPPPNIDNIYIFKYADCCLIDLVEGDDDWQMITMVDLSIRSDTGTINTSPNVSFPSDVKIDYGSSLSLDIRVDDVDGDIVKCRWATKTPIDECGDICQTLSGSTLDEDTCILTYPGGGEVGWYGVALQIEDFVPGNLTVPLSSVSLQFLIQVILCLNPPKLIHPDLAPGQFHDAHLGEEISWRIGVLQGNGTNCSMSDLYLDTSPFGMTITPLEYIGDKQWHAIIKWTPSSVGIVDVCWIAEDNEKQENKACLKLDVQGPSSTEPPSTEPPTPEPTSTEPPSTEPPTLKPSSTEPPSTEPPTPEPTSTEPPSTEPPTPESTSTEPPSTEPPSTEPPTHEPTSTEPTTTAHIPMTVEPQTTVTDMVPSTEDTPNIVQATSSDFKDEYGWLICVIVAFIVIMGVLAIVCCCALKAYPCKKVHVYDSENKVAPDV